MSRRRLTSLADYAPYARSLRGFSWTRWSRGSLYWTWCPVSELLEITPSPICLINLGVKPTGKRSSGNPHAACDVARDGNLASVAAPSLDPTGGGSGRDNRLPLPLSDSSGPGRARKPEPYLRTGALSQFRKGFHAILSEKANPDHYMCSLSPFKAQNLVDIGKRLSGAWFV